MTEPVTEVLVPVQRNIIPERLVDVMRWAPDYHFRKLAILFNNQKSMEHYLVCGKLLCDADRGKDWKHDGSDALNFYQWVEKELRMKRSQVQRQMQIWNNVKHLIPRHADLIVEVEYSKLAMIAGRLKGLDEEHQLQLIHVAKENSVRDLENNLREMRGDIATDSCEHDGPTEIWHRCSTCHKFYKPNIT